MLLKRWLNLVGPYINVAYRWYTLYVFLYNLGNGRLRESRGPATLSYVACTNRTTTQHLCDLRFAYGNQHVCWITFPWWWQVKINRTKKVFFKGIESRSDILKKFIFIKNVLHVSARYSY